MHSRYLEHLRRFQDSSEEMTSIKHESKGSACICLQGLAGWFASGRVQRPDEDAENFRSSNEENDKEAGEFEIEKVC